MIKGLKLPSGMEIQLLDFMYTGDTTKCIVLVKKIEIPFEGFAFRYNKDHPRRSIGRKVALTNAIKSFPKEDRNTIWEKYFSLSPKSKLIRQGNIN